MIENLSTIPVEYVHQLLNTPEERLVDGIIGGYVLDPRTTSPIQITSWEKRSDGKYIRLRAYGRSLAFSSQELQDKTQGLVWLSGSPDTKSLSAAFEKREEEERQSRERFQAMALQRQAEKLALEERIQRGIEEKIQNYRNVLLNHAREKSGQIRAQLQTVLPILPTRYDPSPETLANVAVDWLKIWDSSPFAHVDSIFQLDPFLKKTRELWVSKDDWENMRLIRHFTDASFCEEALHLSIVLLDKAVDHELRRAIKNSVFSTLSRSGLLREADDTGRQIFIDEGLYHVKFARSLWGHYSRWPQLDDDGRMMGSLQEYFALSGNEGLEPGKSPSPIVVASTTIERMRKLFKSSEEVLVGGEK